MGRLREPLGKGGEAYANVGVFHGNLDEAAACVGLKAKFLEAHGAADSLEQHLDRAGVAAVAGALLGRGAGVVLITLGPRGCYGAAADAATLRRTLGRACPRNVDGLAGKAAFAAAYAVEGSVNSVGAGDAFLGGCVAALLLDAGDGDLGRILDLGLASACFRVDTAKGPAPEAAALREIARSLPRLPGFPR